MGAWGRYALNAGKKESHAFRIQTAATDLATAMEELYADARMDLNGILLLNNVLPDSVTAEKILQEHKDVTPY